LAGSRETVTYGRTRYRICLPPLARDRGDDSTFEMLLKGDQGLAGCLDD